MWFYIKYIVKYHSDRMFLARLCTFAWFYMKYIVKNYSDRILLARLCSCFHVVFFWLWIQKYEVNDVVLIRVRIKVFNATFNNMSVISWRSVLLVGEIGVPGENHQPVTQCVHCCSVLNNKLWCVILLFFIW
jgi:hypothetical protein